MKRFLYDPSFWILVAFNGWCIYYYQQHPDAFPTIVWLYWGQSVLIGVFNFFDILTVKNPAPNTMKFDNGKEAKGGCLALFFAVHYGIFHFVYLIFIATMFTKVGAVDWLFVLMGLVAVGMELLISFARRRSMRREGLVNVGALFFLPYLRVVPMHLMILTPAFLNMQASTIFLVLKMIADVLGYFLSTRIMRPIAVTSNQ